MFDINSGQWVYNLNLIYEYHYEQDIFAEIQEYTTIVNRLTNQIIVERYFEARIIDEVFGKSQNSVGNYVLIKQFGSFEEAIQFANKFIINPDLLKSFL